MNANDSERIVTMLAGLGYKPTKVASEADMILLNTCSVRGGAEEKVYNRLANLRIHKKANKDVIIGVGGCVAQQEGEALMQKLPWLDMVFASAPGHGTGCGEWRTSLRDFIYRQRPAPGPVPDYTWPESSEQLCNNHAGVR